MFVKHSSEGKMVVLIVYVDDIVNPNQKLRSEGKGDLIDTT